MKFFLGVEPFCRVGHVRGKKNILFLAQRLSIPMAKFDVVCFCYRKGGNLSGFIKNGRVESGEFDKAIT